MILPDVNVLIYAHREQAPDHIAYHSWLLNLVTGPSPYAFSDLVLSSFVRIVTNSRIFVVPTPLEDAIQFADQLRQPTHAVRLTPGRQHWSIFVDLCRRVGARGNLVPDAYLAALAIESGSEFVTTDSDFSRFPGLRWRHPLS